MREAEENIKFKMEIDVLVPIPRTVTRDFTSLKHLNETKHSLVIAMYLKIRMQLL